MKALKYILTLTLLMSLGACSTSEVKKEMVTFEKAFIPTFYYAYINDMERAEKALFVLERKFTNLRSNFEQHAPFAHEWQSSIQMVDNWLEEAQYAIKKNDAFLALLQLDHARYELMDLRWREDIDFYLDKLYDLEGAIDIAVDVGTDPMLDLCDWGDFNLMVKDVEASWEIVARSSWEKELFEFSKEEEAKEADRKFELGMSIKTFVMATAYADQKAIAKAAKAMEISYLNYLYTFGDFSATQTYYAYKSDTL